MKSMLWGCALALITAAPAAAQAWGLNEARQACQGAGGEAIGGTALRLAIHPHTPKTATVQTTVNPDGAELVFNFTVGWTTSMMETQVQTIIVARISEKGFQSAAVQHDTSKKTTQESIARMQGFLRDVLWPMVRGRVIDLAAGWARNNYAAACQALPSDLATGLFNAGSFGGSAYYLWHTTGVTSAGELLVVVVILWEKGLMKTNHQTILRWRFGQAGHIGLETESTSNPSNPDGMTSYLRDTVLPHIRGRLRF